MKRLLTIGILATILLTAGYTSTTAAGPGCQTMCFDYSAAFIQQCYIATGDSVACTQAGSYVYDDCMRNNCPGRPPR